MSSSVLSAGSFSRQSLTVSLRVKDPIDSARSSSSESTWDSCRPTYVLNHGLLDENKYPVPNCLWKNMRLYCYKLQAPLYTKREKHWKIREFYQTQAAKLAVRICNNNKTTIQGLRSEYGKWLGRYRYLVYKIQKPFHRPHAK
jgi:hypothetical protein